MCAAPSRHSLRFTPVGELRGKDAITQAVPVMGFSVVFCVLGVFSSITGVGWGVFFGVF